MTDLRTQVGRAYMTYLRERWKRQPYVEIPLAGTPIRFVGLADDDCMWAGYEMRRGRWERDVLAYFAARIQLGDTILDVGAFMGQYALLASKLAGPTGRVVAFEPDPVARRRLERNIAVNAAWNVQVVAVEGAEQQIVSSGNVDTLRDARAVIVEVHESRGADSDDIRARYAECGKRPTELEVRGGALQRRVLSVTARLFARPERDPGADGDRPAACEDQPRRAVDRGDAVDGGPRRLGLRRGTESHALPRRSHVSFRKGQPAGGRGLDRWARGGTRGPLRPQAP